MQHVYVSSVIAACARDIEGLATGMVGEREGEMLFYAMKAQVAGPEAPIYKIVFQWPEAFYTVEFFTSLFGFVLDDPAVDYFVHLLGLSDLREDECMAQMVEDALAELGVEVEA